MVIAKASDQAEGPQSQISEDSPGLDAVPLSSALASLCGSTEGESAVTWQNSEHRSSL